MTVNGKKMTESEIKEALKQLKAPDSVQLSDAELEQASGGTFTPLILSEAAVTVGSEVYDATQGPS